MKSSEAIPLYIVRFMRLDDYPDEEYNYIRKSDAEKHFVTEKHKNPVPAWKSEVFFAREIWSQKDIEGV